MSHAEDMADCLKGEDVSSKLKSVDEILQRREANMNSKHEDHPQGEAANTRAMKLVKDDAELVAVLQEQVEDVVHTMTKLHIRGIHAEIGLDNGQGPFKVPKLLNFVVRKDLLNFQTEDQPPQGAPGMPQRR